MKIVADHRENNPYRKPLVRELVTYNDKNGPLENWQYVGFYALDDEGHLIGGLQGMFEWDVFFIKHLWVKTSGQGLGRQLMNQAETHAKENGKAVIHLDTFAFQSKIFYEKCGFTLFGTLENAAGPHARHFLMKRIG